MSGSDFIRFFVIFSEAAPSSANAPGGYCKVESVEKECVFTLSLRNLSSEQAPYRLYITQKGIDTPVTADEFTPGGDGNLYKSISTLPDNIFGSNESIRSAEAMYVLGCNDEAILSGYINRNMPESLRLLSDGKLKNIHREHEFKAASTEENNNEEVFEEVFFDSPADIEEQPTADVITESDERNGAETSPEPPKTSSISSYIETLQHLYEGLTGASKHTDDKKEQSIDASCAEYRATIQNAYTELFDKNECLVPFTLFPNSSKWILQGTDKGSQILTGLIYEEGHIAYIANGIPVYRHMFCIPDGVKNMVWMPASENNFGVIGYWLTFIDAESGKLTDICKVLK